MNSFIYFSVKGPLDCDGLGPVIVKANKINLLVFFERGPWSIHSTKNTRKCTHHTVINKDANDTIVINQARNSSKSLADFIFKFCKESRFPSVTVWRISHSSNFSTFKD